VPEGDASHAASLPRTRPAGARMRRRTVALVLLVHLLAVAAWGFDLGPRWFGFDYPSPVEQPAAVPPPPGLTLPDPDDPSDVAATTDDVTADPDAVRRAVARSLKDRRLGRGVGVAVSELSTGEVVYRTGERRVTPASTLKMLTSTVALATLGPDHRFRTTVVQGSGRRRIVLVGGGDPLLSRRPVAADESYPPRADVQTLARATAKALRDVGRTKVRLGYDASLFAEPAVSPDWRTSYVPDNVVSPISALWVDGGRSQGSYVRSADPALAAAASFAEALERRGIDVRGAPREEAAADDAEELAAVEGAPLAQVVQHVLETSDNEGAEVLFRQAAVATDREGSFDGGAETVHAVLDELGVDTARDRVLDGSGLARGNRLQPETLLSVIQAAASDEHAELRPVLTGLPVAGFTGSLTYRFDTGDPAGLGDVRAKTGTLTGVHGLAGTVTTQDGVVLGFVAIADKVKVPDTLEARARIDELAGALAACDCRAGA
jgi:D-alanyl-D-alanine carboxypeptidase/D-alanyl-D-alanine-endopeptidase (penicillin-binding protein 4)